MWTSSRYLTFRPHGWLSFVKKCIMGWLHCNASLIYYDTVMPYGISLLVQIILCHMFCTKPLHDSIKRNKHQWNLNLTTKFSSKRIYWKTLATRLWLFYSVRYKIYHYVRALILYLLMLFMIMSGTNNQRLLSLFQYRDHIFWFRDSHHKNTMVWYSKWEYCNIKTASLYWNDPRFPVLQCGNDVILSVMNCLAS